MFRREGDGEGMLGGPYVAASHVGGFVCKTQRNPNTHKEIRRKSKSEIPGGNAGMKCWEVPVEDPLCVRC